MNSNDPYRPKDLARHRKELSDIKNNTSELTFGNNNNDSRAAAYQKSRELKDLMELAKLEDDYLNDYE